MDAPVFQSCDEIPNPFGGPILWQAESPSTMEGARQWIQDSDLRRGRVIAGAVLGCRHQTAGLGRIPGRRWLSPPGQALTFSIILPPRRDYPRSMVLALGLCTWLEEMGLKPEVKWPNDLLLADRKICGILVQSRLSATTTPDQNPPWEICGIGINVSQTRFPQADLRRPATSLLLEGRATSDWHLPSLLGHLLGHLKPACDLEAEAIRVGLESRLWRRDQEWEFVDAMGPHPPRRGLIRGLGDRGQLQLETGKGLEELWWGE